MESYDLRRNGHLQAKPLSCLGVVFLVLYASDKMKPGWGGQSTENIYSMAVNMSSL